MQYMETTVHALPSIRGAGRVLVVADDPDTMAVLHGFLERRLGLDVTATASGVEAVARIGSGRFDAVVLDPRLRDCSGVDVLEAMRGNRMPPGVIVYSAFIDFQLIVDVLNTFPVSGVYQKPDELDALVEAIQVQVRRGRRARQHHAAYARALRHTSCDPCLP